MKISTKKLNQMLWAEIGLDIFALVIGLSLGIPLLFLPFPETINVAYMDKYMIAEGQGTFLILATTLVFLLVPSLLSLFVISCLNGYYVIFAKNVINTNVKRQTKIYFMCLFILNLLLPAILAPILMSLNKKDNSSLVYTIINSKLTANQTKWWKSFAIISSIVLALVGPITIFGLMARKYDTPNRQQDLIDMYTISEKEPNTMALYFDRGYGLLFNLLFLVDWVVFKDNSFIEQFPEFTSYGQSLTHSNVTNGSNPSINGSWYFMPELKNTKLFNEKLNLDYNKLNMNDWFKYSYYSGFNMFKNYGYENISMFSNPYYDTKTYQCWTNDIKLQNDLNEMFDQQKSSNFDVKVMDVSVAKNNYFLTNDRANWKDEVRLLRYFASSTNEIKPNQLNDEEYSYGNNQFITLNNGKEVNINLRTSKSKKSTYLFFHSQVTHQPYGWLVDESLKTQSNKLGLNYQNIDVANKIVTGSDKTDYMVNSTWYTIQKLKRIFKYLKNLPCNDPQRPWVKNQYDNMNIYIFSDHGKQIHYDNSVQEIFDILCSQNNVLNTEQRDFLVNGIINSDASLGGYNSIFIRKPTLYSNESGLNKQFDNANSKTKQFFNYSQLVTNADFYPIIEADLYAQTYNSKNRNKKSIDWKEFESIYELPSKESLLKNIENETLKNILIRDFYNNVLVNPLNNEKANTRTIPLFSLSWKFHKNSFKYKFKNKFIYTPQKVEVNNSVYNTSNYIDVKDEVDYINK